MPRLSPLFTLFALVGCYGESGIMVRTQDDPTLKLPEGTPTCTANELGPTTLRRLNKYQYDRTASALVGAKVAPGRDLPDDTTHFGFSNNGDGQSIDPALFERYEAASAELAAAIVNPPAGATRTLPACSPGEACARTQLLDLARRAWRRPVASAELDVHVTVVTDALAEGLSFDAAMKLGAQAVLLSPNFLFHLEGDAIGVHRISGYELASRLSYFVWGSMPDDELFAAAEAGKLADDAEVARQARRMLADARSSALTDTFANEWLEVSKASSIQPNAELFPGIDTALKTSMRRETELSFGALLHGEGSYGDLFDGRFTYLDDRLAEHYGLPKPGGTEFTRVALETDQRGGLLKQAGFLSITSAPNRTSIVKRGQWVLTRLLCEELAFPDMAADDFAKTVQPGTTLREQLEAHRANPACASCHQRMDPIGFGLEHYDAVGRWRTTDNGLAIDTRGKLPPDVAFDGATELAGLLKQDHRTTACAVKNLTTFALGRSLKPADGCGVQRTTFIWDARSNKLEELVVLIVTSPQFTQRTLDEEVTP